MRVTDKLPITDEIERTIYAVKDDTCPSRSEPSIWDTEFLGVTAGRIFRGNTRRIHRKWILHIGVDGFIVPLKLPVTGHIYAIRVVNIMCLPRGRNLLWAVEKAELPLPI